MLLCHAFGGAVLPVEASRNKARLSVATAALGTASPAFSSSGHLDEGFVTATIEFLGELFLVPQLGREVGTKSLNALLHECMLRVADGRLKNEYKERISRLVLRVMHRARRDPCIVAVIDVLTRGTPTHAAARGLLDPDDLGAASSDSATSAGLGQTEMPERSATNLSKLLDRLAQNEKEQAQAAARRARAEGLPAPHGPFGSPRFNLEAVLMSLHQFFCTVMRPAAGSPAGSGSGSSPGWGNKEGGGQCPPPLTPAELSYRARAMPVRSCLAMLRDVVRHRGRDVVTALRHLVDAGKASGGPGGPSAAASLGSSLSAGLSSLAAAAAGMPVTESSLLFLYVRRFLTLDQPALAEQLKVTVPAAAVHQYRDELAWGVGCMRRAAAAATAAVAVGDAASARRKSSQSSTRVSKDARKNAQQAAESLLALEGQFPALADEFEACLLEAEEAADRAAAGEAGTQASAGGAANRAASVFVHDLARRRIARVQQAMQEQGGNDLDVTTMTAGGGGEGGPEAATASPVDGEKEERVSSGHRSGVGAYAGAASGRPQPRSASSGPAMDDEGMPISSAIRTVDTGERPGAEQGHGQGQGGRQEAAAGPSTADSPDHGMGLGGHSVLDATTGSPGGMGMQEAMRAIYGGSAGEGEGEGEGDGADSTAPSVSKTSTPLRAGGGRGGSAAGAGRGKAQGQAPTPEEDSSGDDDGTRAAGAAPAQMQTSTASNKTSRAPKADSIRSLAKGSGTSSGKPGGAARYQERLAALRAKTASKPKGKSKK